MVLLLVDISRCLADSSIEADDTPRTNTECWQRLGRMIDVMLSNSRRR